MTTPTTTSEGEVIVRYALKRTLYVGRPPDFDVALPTSELAKQAKRGQFTLKGTCPDVVQALMLDALRYADSDMPPNRIEKRPAMS